MKIHFIFLVLIGFYTNIFGSYASDEEKKEILLKAVFEQAPKKAFKLNEKLNKALEILSVSPEEIVDFKGQLDSCAAYLTESSQAIGELRYGIDALNIIRLKPLYDSVAQCFGWLQYDLNTLAKSIKKDSKNPFIQEAKVDLQPELQRKLLEIIRFKCALWDRLQYSDAAKEIFPKDDREGAKKAELLKNLSERLKEAKSLVTLKKALPVWLNFLQILFGPEGQEDRDKALESIKTLMKIALRNRNYHPDLFNSREFQDDEFLLMVTKYFLDHQQDCLQQVVAILNTKPKFIELIRQVLKGEAKGSQLLSWFIPPIISISNGIKVEFAEELEAWFKEHADHPFYKYKDLIEYFIMHAELRSEDVLDPSKFDNPEFRTIIDNIMHDKTTWPALIDWLMQQGILELIVNKLNMQDEKLKTIVTNLIEDQDAKEIILCLLEQQKVKACIQQLITDSEFKKHLKKAANDLLSKTKEERRLLVKALGNPFLCYVISHQSLGNLITTINSNPKMKDVIKKFLRRNKVPYSGVLTSWLVLRVASLGPVRSFAGRFLPSESGSKKPDISEPPKIVSNYNLLAYLEKISASHCDFGLKGRDKIKPDKGKEKVTEDSDEEELYGEFADENKFEERCNKKRVLVQEIREIKSRIGKLADNSFFLHESDKKMEEGRLESKEKELRSLGKSKYEALCDTGKALDRDIEKMQLTIIRLGTLSTRFNFYYEQLESLKKELQELGQMMEVMTKISTGELSEDAMRQLVVRYVNEMYDSSLEAIKKVMSDNLLEHAKSYNVAQSIPQLINNILFVPGLSNVDGHYFDASEELRYKVFRLWIRAHMNKYIEENDLLSRIKRLRDQIEENQVYVAAYEEAINLCEGECDSFIEEKEKAETWKFSQFFSRFWPTKLVAIIGNRIKTWWNRRLIREKDQNHQEMLANKRSILSENEACKDLVVAHQEGLCGIEQNKTLQLMGLLFKRSEQPLIDMPSNYLDKNLSDFNNAKLLADYIDPLFWYCIHPKFRPRKSVEEITSTDEGSSSHATTAAGVGI